MDIMQKSSLSQSTQGFKGFWDSTWEKIGHEIETTVAPLILNKEDTAGKAVLEIGCGSLCCDEHASNAGSYVGMDISMLPLRRAAESHGNLAFAQGDASMLPFRDESFDSIIFIQAAPFFCKNMDRVMRESRRALKIGGRLVFDMPHVDMREALLSKKASRLNGEAMHHGVFYASSCASKPDTILYDEKGMAELLSDAGLDLEGIKVLTRREFYSIGMAMYEYVEPSPYDNVKTVMFVRAIRRG
jgi:SAM-dependent methyltransferase